MSFLNGAKWTARMTLPQSVMTGLKIFHRGHRIWYLNRRFDKFFENPKKNLYIISLGYSLDSIVKDTFLAEPIDRMARAAAVGRSMLHFTEEMHVFARSYQEGVQTIFNRSLFHVKAHIFPASFRCRPKEFLNGVDPFAAFYLKVCLQLLAKRIETVALYVLAVCRAALDLSCALARLIETYVYEDRLDIISNKGELISNMDAAVKNISELQRILKRELLECSEMIDRFLTLGCSSEMVKDLKAALFVESPIVKTINHPKKEEEEPSTAKKVWNNFYTTFNQWWNKKPVNANKLLKMGSNEPEEKHIAFRGEGLTVPFSRE